MFRDQGRDHIPAGERRSDYNSNPPTSGPHGPVAAWGVHDDAVPKESAIHNMEHGGVVVWYDCGPDTAPLSQDDCLQLKEQLTAVVGPEWASGKYVLMTFYPAMERRIALTAWTYLDTFDEFDEGRVRAFIGSFECRFNPEGFCN